MIITSTGLDMDILGIDTDNETKGISVSNPLNENKEDDIKSPKLSVVDSIGVELLTNRGDEKKDGYLSDDNSVKSGKSDKDEVNMFGFGSGPQPNDEPNPVQINADVDEGDNFIMKKNEGSDFTPIHRMTPTDIKNEKIDYIYKFKKLGEQGIRTTMNYNMNSNLEEMRNEYLKLKKQREIDNSVKFQRKALMAFVTGLEFLNNKIDPFSIQLDGWSESVNENIFDYDEIFEELHMKYGGDTEVAPEIRLMFALGGSAFMFHLQNTMFKSSMPGMDDILRQNPELMKQFASAAVGSMGSGAQGPMNPMNQGPRPMGPMAGGPSPNNRRSGVQRGNPRQGPPSGGSTPRQEMNGPDGIDDLIKTMNLEPNNIPDLDNISLVSGDTDRKSGITLNL